MSDMIDFGFGIADFGLKRGAPPPRGPSARGLQSKITNPKSKICPRRPAFTLMEMLVVIGLILIIIVMAVPAFNLLSGSGSQEAAQNQLSALMGRARMEAIGLQEVRGVFFYIDPDTQRVYATLVAGATPAGNFGANPPQRFLDLLPDRDYLALPPGVSVQTLDDADLTTANPPVRRDDSYVGFNYVDDKEDLLKYGGVILFDGNGRVINDTYGFLVSYDPDDNRNRPGGTNGPIDPVATEMGKLLMRDPGLNASGNKYILPEPRKDLKPVNYLRSQLGLVVYDVPTFRSVHEAGGDPDIDLNPRSYPASEKEEELWLDANGTPLLINRFNGTLAPAN